MDAVTGIVVTHHAARAARAQLHIVSGGVMSSEMATIPIVPTRAIRMLPARTLPPGGMLS
jgi:hypothetical protein